MKKNVSHFPKTVSAFVRLLSFWILSILLLSGCRTCIYGRNSGSFLHCGNIPAAARVLSLSTRQIFNKINEYNIEKPF